MLVAGMDSAKPERSPFPLPHLLALIFLSIIIIVSWRHEDNVQPAGEPEPIVLEGLVNRGVDSGSIGLAEGNADTAALVNDESATGDNPDSAAKTRAEIKAALNSLAQNPSSDAAAINTSDPVNATESLADMPATVVLAGSQQDVAVVNRSANRSANTSVDAPDEAGVNTQTDSVEAKAEVKKAATASGDNQTATNQATASLDNSASSSQAVIKVESAHKRLMAWSELGYALQIFGTHNAKRAKQLVDEYFGSADLLFYETRHNGKPWFVVVNGPYSGRQAARLSIEQLPESLQRLRPWTRNIASIQADIRRYGAAIAADQ
jgi:DamX protein